MLGSTSQSFAPAQEKAVIGLFVYGATRAVASKTRQKGVTLTEKEGEESTTDCRWSTICGIMPRADRVAAIKHGAAQVAPCIKTGAGVVV